MSLKVAQLNEVEYEMSRQVGKFGVQNHPDGTGGELAEDRVKLAKAECDFRTAEGKVTWRDILEEEVAEAFAETDPALLRTELIQVAAVAASWVAAIDRRTRKPVVSKVSK